MILLTYEQLRARALDRPDGYVDDVVAHASRVAGGVVELTDAVWTELSKKYNPGMMESWGPRLEELLTDYAAATRSLQDVGLAVVPCEQFFRRLQKCRACPRGWWDEGQPDGFGRCQDVRRACAKIALWRLTTKCGLRQW